MKTKAQLQISFGWMFALIVGAFILFLAIFASTRIIKVGETEIDAKTAKQIGIITNPLEIGIESSRAAPPMNLNVETRIYDKCESDGVFGRQLIQVSQKSFNKWTETDINVGFSNKYFFSKDYVEGKSFYLFGKPFEFPFKVADLIYMTEAEKSYCFKEAPADIVSEISDWGRENFKVENCSSEDIEICFEDSGCDVDVNVNEGVVEKGNDKLYFEGDALMYAAIFSEKDHYECQLKRLMKRLSVLAQIYMEKQDLIIETECGSNSRNELLSVKGFADDFKNSANLGSIGKTVKDLEKINDDSVCRLW